MIVYVLLGLLPALGILMLILGRPQKKQAEAHTSLRQFQAQGRAAGFSSGEIRRLREMALRSGKINPFSLFQSAELMDHCIRSLARAMRRGGDNNPAAEQNLISKLYECRKKIEAEGPKRGLITSREIEAGQNLRVVSDAVIYRSQVIKNADQYLLATRPVNPELRSAPSWLGRKISVYFWKEEDAGYVFDCKVLDEALIKGVAAVQLSHSKDLFRTQKRRSLRVKTHKLTYLYLLNDGAPSDTLETRPGLKCFVEDLSDTGCAVTIGGKAGKGLRVKLQFELNKKPFSMSGTVRSVDYNGETNRSLLHIEADPLSQEAKNAIFAEMFDAAPSR
ncbi:MAG: PilZ domain-containing protein [Treponema sp.]|jgi:c-di-GMP-binding flagellar brake protein YcgR|nr:PilZ domain-containing protein [Treponema sp.]